MDDKSKDLALRAAVEGTVEEFRTAINEHFGDGRVKRYDDDQMSHLKQRWAEWPDNPYKIVTQNELFRSSVEDVFDTFIHKANRYYGGNVVNDMSLEEKHKLRGNIAEHVDNPYRKEKPVPPPLKKFMVTFARIGPDPDYQGFMTVVRAPELAATIAPITKMINDIYEDEYEIPKPTSKSRSSRTRARSTSA